ncbi:hypothetical protein FHW02_004369 [Ochrobactrum sp. RH1CCR137]|uniref:hypothetical protein n=1 Tax=Brucella intermedia TaxID=94625 RepID=UPI0013CF1FAA|nr:MULTISPECIES: hypothetical protein [Brucella/Ochrobactrum group]MBA8846279.1 hypothetical protein [Ochrobactrum sp. RH1CCR137]MBA8858097.1 hypothetical protein [Ochrobactrum sp. RH1CCR134]MCB4919711.1 hypothetical protein [Brucella intermedia]
MRIFLSPQRSDTELTLSAHGDVLIINGDALDFSDLPDGGEYPPEAIDNPFVVGTVTRVNGEIQITVLMPYSNPNPPQTVSFPAPIVVSKNGPIDLPDGRSLEENDAAE